MVKIYILFILILSSLINIIKSDIPAHCSSDKTFGKWKFHLFGKLFKPSLFYEKSTCGHSYPGQWLRENDENQELPYNIFKTYELELKNDFTVYENGEKVGKWTNVYDQSFIVYYKDSVFYAQYRYYIHKNGFQFLSNCDRTMNGWFTLKEYESNDNDNDNQLMACFVGEKIGDENDEDKEKDDEVILKSIPPKKKINTKVLKNMKMKDLQIIVDEINKSNLTWKAKINPEDLELSFYEYYKKYIGIKDNDIFEQEEDNDYNSFDKNIFLRNLAESKSMINQLISSIKNIRPKEKITTDNSELNNDSLRELDSHYITDKDEILKYINTPLDEIDEKTLPKNWDWRDVGGENFYSEEIIQGGCGSCYAVSTISILESRLRIKTLNKDQTKLSIQFPVSCSFYTEGCKGGYPIVLGKFFHDFEIIPRECFEYQKNDKNCENVCDYEKYEKKYFVSDYGYIGGFYGAATEALMMKELRARGPITGNLRTPFMFSMFSGGIYSSKEIVESISMEISHKSLYEDNIFFQEVNHSTTIVGYGEENGVKYWICMNSLGKNWGENGYYRILRGENERGIESMPEYLNIEFVNRKK